MSCLAADGVQTSEIYLQCQVDLYFCVRARHFWLVLANEASSLARLPGQARINNATGREYQFSRKNSVSVF